MFGAGTTLWKWLRRMVLRVAARHVVLLMTKKKLWGWQLTVRGCYDFCVVSLLLCTIMWQDAKVAIYFLLHRAVARMTSERRQKSQKAKPKPSEGRMHLTNVRVIQRNLVYIIGLPINLADEDVSIFYTIVYFITPLWSDGNSFSGFFYFNGSLWLIILSCFYQLLQRKEYFGQYGKVLKVSISRTATGAIQHSANNSCCV